MRQIFEGPIAARAAIMTFAADGGFAPLSAENRAKVIELASQPSPVAAIAEVAEFLYAQGETLTNGARDLVDSLASYAAENAWFDMQVDGRGARIALVMRRENGETAPEGSAFPDPEADPKPLARFGAPTPPVLMSPAAE